MRHDLETVLARINRVWKTEFEPLEVDGHVYEVLAITNMTERLNRLIAENAIQKPLQDLPLWAKIWPGSIILGRFLRNHAPQGKTLLEIGCGTGALSLVASAHGFAQITATDIEPQALDFARAHMLKNGLQELVEIRHLDVASPKAALAKPFDMIAASELLYLDNLHRPLLKFIRRNLADNGKAFFCTDLARARPRFQKLASREFRVTEGKIGMKTSGEDQKPQTRVYSILILERP